jgi:hypothetical protein
MKFMKAIASSLSPSVKAKKSLNNRTKNKTTV